MKETRGFGPPGTGKTTWLTRQIQRAVQKYGKDKVVVSSFSKAAAMELVGRDIDAARSQVGTLHSICYRALGSPEIAETKAAEWNREYPQFAISANTDAKAIDNPEQFESSSEGDLLMKYNLIRGQGKKNCEMMLDAAERQKAAAVSGKRFIEFVSKWEEWKERNNLFDFTDLLVMAHDDFKAPPGNPAVGFFDEVQDFNPLMLELIRQWSDSLEHSVLVGDDDQTIYGFMGASPSAFLEGTPEKEVVLDQSYRIPRAVHEWSDKWIKQVKGRKDKVFKPRDEEGEVIGKWRGREAIHYKQAVGVADMLEADLRSADTVMILASCSYMLIPVMAELKRRGVPFANRYRPLNGSWNPFPQATEKRVPAWRRLTAFLEAIVDGREWRRNEVTLWTGHLSKKSGGVRPGFGADIWRGRGGLEPVRTLEVFDGGDGEDVPFYGDTVAALEWFEANLTGAKRGAYESALGAVRSGYGGDLSAPRVTVGTIHSVKGGEADSVYLCPDLSGQGAQGYFRGGGGRDSVVRLLYVGGTRARRKLTLLGAVNWNTAVRWQS